MHSLRSIRTMGLAIGIGLSSACTESHSFTPMGDETYEIRHMFEVAGTIVGEPEVLVVESAREVDDYRVTGAGYTAIYPNSVEVVGTLVNDRGEERRATFRGPLASGSCGHREDDPTFIVCSERTFAFESAPAPGSVWAVLTAELGGPEAGNLTAMAAREVPPDVDRIELARDLRAFLRRH